MCSSDLVVHEGRDYYYYFFFSFFSFLFSFRVRAGFFCASRFLSLLPLLAMIVAPLIYMVADVKRLNLHPTS